MTQDDFADWIRPHMGRLLRTARAFAEPADVHDLFQELLITAWKARPAFRGDSSAATFIYRVAHNRALTWKRRQGLMRLRFLGARPDITDLLHPPSEDAGRLEDLYAAVRQLPPLDRSLMLLSLDGVSYGDIAELHGLSETNVGARLSRARARLAALIAEISDEP